MQSKASKSAFLTTEQVLDCLKVNPRTIYRLIKTGELPAIRIGRQWRFRRADLDDWIDRQQTTASKAGRTATSLHRRAILGGYQ
jgi:excisionase family DNA binding protein